MIKKYFCTLLSTGALFLVCSLPSTVFAEQQTPHVNEKQTTHARERQTTHVRASSHENQFPSAEGPHHVGLEHLDASTNIAQISNHKFRVEKSGTYLIIATGQAGVNIVAPPGHLDFWLIKNDAPISNTGARVTLPNSNATTVVISQTVLELAHHDLISVGYSSSSSSIGLLAIPPSSPNEPGIPSATLSVILIRP